MAFYKCLGQPSKLEIGVRIGSLDLEVPIFPN